MKTVWDKRNKKWVNIPAEWVDSPDFEELFSLEKPAEDAPNDSEDVTPVTTETPPDTPVDKAPAKATTKKEGK